MKLTPWMLSVTAFLIIAALAVGFIMKKAFAGETPSVPAPAMQVIPMALSDIQPGTPIQAAFLGDGQVYSTALSEHRDIVLSRSAVIGRVAKERIPMATPLRLSMLYPIGSGPEIRISPGNRLVSVRVDGSAGTVSGLIKPGTHVDVMMTVDRRTNDTQVGESMVLQLFDGVHVFAVNRSSANSTQASSEVVLELSPQQQQIMILAQEKGRINLSYNPQGPGTGGVNIRTSRSNRVTLSEILGTDTPPTPAEKPFVTEQYRNGGHKKVYYNKDGVPVSPSNAMQNGNTESDQQSNDDLTTQWVFTDEELTHNASMSTRIASGSRE